MDSRAHCTRLTRRYSPHSPLLYSKARDLADLADKYVPGGEVRLTVEENCILPNVKEEDLAALCAEPALNAPSRLSVNPGRIAGNVVSCTGAQVWGPARRQGSVGGAHQQRLRATHTVPHSPADLDAALRPLHTVAASLTHGCSLRHVRL